MAYIKCCGCGLCVKCIVTNYCKHIYVYDLGGVYMYGVLVLGVLGSRVMIVVPLFWYFFGGGYLLILLGYGLGLVTSSSVKMKS
jgi:hypothetical protein